MRAKTRRKVTRRHGNRLMIVNYPCVRYDLRSILILVERDSPGGFPLHCGWVEMTVLWLESIDHTNDGNVLSSLRSRWTERRLKVLLLTYSWHTGGMFLSMFLFLFRWWVPFILAIDSFLLNDDAFFNDVYLNSIRENLPVLVQCMV